MLADQILIKDQLSRQELVYLLTTRSEREKHTLFRKAYQVKKFHVGPQVYLRGLIEYSNLCRKDCLYCGIRKSNEQVSRYQMDTQEVIDLGMSAWRKGFASVVIQSGERTDKDFIKQITEIIRGIMDQSANQVGITLSCGEQTAETYREWFEAGAHRYLLRIESSSEELFRKIHPDNELHSFSTRMAALENIRKAGFQTGTGVMIGLPYQTAENLADDLLFFKSIDIDMIGMGPYIPHKNTPLGLSGENILTDVERMDLSMRMIALARIIMPDINIATSTALQAIDEDGRLKGLLAGANVYMPNMTPLNYAENYFLYDGKPLTGDQAVKCIMEMEKRLKPLGETISYGKFGDSKHYFKRIMKN